VANGTGWSCTVGGEARRSLDGVVMGSLEVCRRYKTDVYTCIHCSDNVDLTCDEDANRHNTANCR
jgi:hypothetical protein